MKRVSWMPMALSSLLLYAFIYAPLAVVVVYSFNAARFGSAWAGFTTQWYRSLAENEFAINSAVNTLVLACASTGISTLLGVAMGFGLARSPRLKWVATLLYIPVFIPDIVLAVALLMFYGVVKQWLGVLELGMTTMVISHATFQISFVALVVRARLVGLDPALEEAARDLGATEWQVFWKVTLPLMLPGILAGALLAFTLSLDDFVVSFFTSGAGSMTLPILIYSSVKRGITPEINALSTLLLAACILGTILMALMRSYQDRNR